jgi:hypothetical protein
MPNVIQWNGETITEPGIYSGISLEDYHNKLDLLDAESVSKSSLKRLFRSLKGSPKEFWNLWAYNPDHITLKPSEELDLGKCTHALLMGDEVFEDRFSVRPEKWGNYNTKAAREWRDSVRAAGKTPITLEQIEKIRRIAEDASRDPMVQQGILNGTVERSMFFKDEATGLWFRSRPDNLALDGFWADLKTTSSMEPSFIRRQAEQHGYFLQGAGVRRACRELGLPFEAFANVYVSTGDTPDTQAIELDPADMEIGEQMIQAGLEQIAACMKSGIWPGARPYEGDTLRMSDFHRDAIKQDLRTPHIEEAA